MKENEHGWEEPNACPICNGPLKYSNWWIEDVKFCLSNHKICLSLQDDYVSNIYLDHNKFILNWNKEGFFVYEKSNSKKYWIKLLLWSPIRISKTIMSTIKFNPNLSDYKSLIKKVDSYILLS